MFSINALKYCAENRSEAVLSLLFSALSIEAAAP